MVTLDLSRVDRKAQGPLELMSYRSLLVPLQATHLSPIGNAQKASPIRKSIIYKERNIQNFIRFSYKTFHKGLSLRS